MSKKYSFDYNRSRNRELEYKKLSREQLEGKAEDIHETIDDKLKLAQKFEEDKRLIEEQIDRVYNSDLAYEDKKEQLYMLKEMIQVLQDEYQEQVEKPIEKKQEEIKEIIDTIEDNREILNEQINNMENLQLKSSTVSLNKAIDATKSIEESFLNLQNDEQKRLQERKRKIEEFRKQMGKDHSRTL